jgi:tetratricopeptide (TPR) repeat protein
MSEKLLEQFIHKVTELQQGRSDIDQASFEQIIRELGLSEEDLSAAEREADKRLVQGRAFRNSELLDRAVEALEHAHALSPFRQDITRELAVTLLTRFRAHARTEDHERAAMLLEANIERDERNTTNYELLRQVQALARPMAHRHVWIALGVGLLVGALATVGVQRMLPVEAAVAPSSQTVDAKDAKQAEQVGEPVTVAEHAPTITRVDPNAPFIAAISPASGPAGT